MATLITGLFRKRIAAEAAVEVILKRGIRRENIGVLLSDATKNKELAIEPRTRAGAGAGIGSAIGAAIGALLAASVTTGANLVVPGLNLIVAAPVAAALAGAGAGSILGNLAGALIGAGMTEFKARVYSTVAQGGVLLGIETENKNEAAQLERLLKDLGAEHIKRA